MPRQEALVFVKISKNICQRCRARMMKNAPCGEGCSKSFLVLFCKKELLASPPGTGGRNYP
jgi:hypothetical protein